MRRSYILIPLSLLILSDGAPILPNIQTGFVPIFGNRVTYEPITFTFTTPIPKNAKNMIKNYPTLRPYSPIDYLPPIHNNNYIQEFKYEVQMPTQPRPFVASTPVYNQAMVYKAMQSSLQQDPYSTYRTIWKQMMDTWIKMRNEIYSDDVGDDWHVFWKKLTGTIEPYMNTISTQVGKLLNVFLRHQHDKEVISRQKHLG